MKIKEFAAKPMTEEERSRQIALLKEKYDWDKIAELILQVYRETRNSSAPGSSVL